LGITLVTSSAGKENDATSNGCSLKDEALLRKSVLLKAACKQSSPSNEAPRENSIYEKPHGTHYRRRSVEP
jgi:hypothetical protein